MQPTTEQLAIIEHVPASGERILVNAGAGSGKTTTCRLVIERHGLEQNMDGQYSPRHPGGAAHRFLYLTFNKTTQLEAESRLADLDAVACKTLHALALEFSHQQIPNFRLGDAKMSEACYRILHEFFRF